MPIALNYTPNPSNPNVTVYWYPTTGFANFASPTVTELNAGLNLSKATAWSNYSFKVSASTTTNDPSLADTANVTDRGAIAYGGNLSFYYPGPNVLSTDSYAMVYAALSQPRTSGYIVTRIDGSKPTTQAFASGDMVNVYLVETDAQTNNITGESAFMYTVNFLNQGVAAINAIAKTTTPTVVVTPATLSLVHPAKQRLDATVNGREYTNGMSWSSSDITKATVSPAGVVSTLAAGSVTITATLPATGTTATCVLTLT